MEGQTSCALCDYKARSIGPLKQHMESKHNVYNMTIVQVLTQQVERVNDLESEVKEKEQLIKKAEVDLKDTKEALRKEKESLEVKEKAINDLIKSQKQRAIEESKTVEELKVTKELLSKAHKDLQTKTNALEAELQKVNAFEVSTQTFSEINYVLNVKQEQHETNIEEKYIAISCRYFHTKNGCRRGIKCWFSHDKNHKLENKSEKLKKKQNKKFKYEHNEAKKANLKDANLQQVMIELLHLLLRERNV